MEQLQLQQANNVEIDTHLSSAASIRVVPIIAEMYRENLISENWANTVFSRLTTAADLEDMVCLLEDSEQKLQLIALRVLVTRKYTPGIPIVRDLIFRFCLDIETNSLEVTGKDSSRNFEEAVARALLMLSSKSADRALILDLARIRYQVDANNYGIYAVIEECAGSELLLES